MDEIGEGLLRFSSIARGWEEHKYIYGHFLCLRRDFCCRHVSEVKQKGKGLGEEKRS